ncbi:MAG: O-antigen ligase family protein, partial [Aggregatilineales bacterium]
NSQTGWALSLLIVIVVLMFSGAFIQNGMLPITATTANAMATGITVLLVLSRLPQILSLRRAGRAILLLTALALFSALWSVVPELSFRRGVVLTAITGIGFYIASRYSLRQQAVFYSRILLFILLASLIVGMVFPVYGIHQDIFQAGRWRGIFLHKNILGEYMSLTTLLFLFMPAQLIKMPRWFKYGMAGLALFLLVLTGSLTSIGAWLVVMLMYPLLMTGRYDFRLRMTLVFITMSISIVILAYIAQNFSEVLALIGRDETFSGRNTIWPFLGELIAQRPILGYGYMSFFVPESYLIEASYRGVWQPEHAHNVWLDMGLSLGIVGVGLFAYILWRSLREIMQMYVDLYRMDVLFVLILLLNILARSMTETLAIQRRDCIWIMLISLTVRLFYEYRQQHNHVTV